MSLKEKFLELTRMKYADQAKWFLNGMWKEGAEEQAEAIWSVAQKFMELDAKKKEGNELDEFWSHKFLESLGDTLTVIALREKLRKIDLDANGRMALLEYLIFKYSKTVQAIIDSPQGDNSEQLKEATAKLQAVQDALLEVQKQLEEEKKALEAQKKAEEDARNSLEAQRKAEELVRKAEAELKAAVDEFYAQENAYKNAIATLEKKANDSTASTVAKSKAANELAQLKGEDPLPLRKAKITQEAALRRVEKDRKAAESATAAAEAKTRAAEESTRAAEAKAKEVEKAVEETERAFQEAQDFLQEVKAAGGVAYGAMWWMERELKEAQKYLPKKKQTL